MGNAFRHPGVQASKIIIKRNPCTKRGEGLVRRVVIFNRGPGKVRIARLQPKKRRDTTLDHSPALSGPAKGWMMDEEGKLPKDRRGTPPIGQNPLPVDGANGLDPDMVCSGVVLFTRKGFIFIQNCRFKRKAQFIWSVKSPPKALFVGGFRCSKLTLAGIRETASTWEPKPSTWATVNSRGG